MRHKENVIRERSSSGGVFYALAEYTLKMGGTVYGAVFDEQCRVFHMRGSDLRDVRKMQGSKYVQSSTTGIFEAVKRDLEEGKRVLFTGCPCQTDALKRYLGSRNQEGLVTCDLVCLGVNSPKVWQDYLFFVSGSKKIRELQFRNKSAGWRNPLMCIRTESDFYRESTVYDYFYQAFYGHLILRDACFTCRYTNMERTGDITIGDFWGIEHVCPQMDDGKGTSLVLLNSLKGREVFQSIRDAFIIKKVQISDTIQPSLQKPAIYPEKYEDFWKDYLRYGFAYVCRKYLNGGIKGKIKKGIRKGLVKIHVLKR